MKKLVAAVRLILTIKCEQSTRLASDSLDRDLSAVERWAVRLHAIGCWSCRRFGKQIRQLREAMRISGAALEDERLSAEAVERIQNAIRQAGADNARQ